MNQSPIELQIASGTACWQTSLYTKKQINVLVVINNYIYVRSNKWAKLMHRIYNLKRALNDIWRKQNVIMKKLYDFWMRNKKVFQIFSRCFPQREWQGSTLLLKPLNIIEAKKYRPAQFAFTLAVS